VALGASFTKLLHKVLGCSKPKGMNNLRSDETSGSTRYGVLGMAWSSFSCLCWYLLSLYRLACKILSIC
jgi:hypothetical protein